MRQLLFSISVILFLLCSSNVLFAQTNDWRDYLQQLAEEGMSSEQVETLFEELTDMESNPLNLNDLTTEDLRRIPFLSEDQRQSMSNFLEKNRPIYSVYELRNIPLFDAATVQMLLPLFVVGEYTGKKEKPSFRNIFLHGKNELQIRFDKVLPQRAGYKDLSDSILQRYPNRVYKGEDFYNSIKYAYTAGKRFQAGLVAEKDAGEPIFRREHRGYDHYGAYLAVKDVGSLKSLVLGDFRLSFGQGLVLNNNFSLGKTSATTSITRRTTVPTRHASTAESGFFRGIASAYAFGDFTITAFYSHRKIDGNLSGDSVITSFKTDGYHRTQLERSKAGNVLEQVAGANFQFQRNRFQIGASMLYYQYNKLYQPDFQEYNRFYFRGKSNFNGSIDYSYRFRRFSLAGELAMSENGSMAALNALNFYPKQGISLSVLQRQFSRSYQANYANAFSDGSSVQNESGWYVGSQFSPLAKLRMAMYADVVSFPWLKYGLNAPSHSFDYFVQGNYRYDSNLSFDVRYRFRQRETNAKYPDEKTTAVLPYDQHKILLQASKTLSTKFYLRTILDWNSYKIEHFSVEQGWMISQLVSWKNPKKWKSDLSIGYFKSDSYSVRVYSREQNIINSFYMPSFYGKGMRMSLSGKYDFSRSLTLALKAGLTKYFDRNTIGSDLEEIDASHRIDVMTYLRWRF
ncbi:MAG: hypothetical protein H6Q14_2690 [Bacteroidetes bacterium]|nr:hypothetical protein [Bacteroidota bacterium]